MKTFLANASTWLTVLMILILSVAVDACGKFTVEHDVVGAVNFQFQQDPNLYIPFFVNECVTRVPTQACYDVDAFVCARCMSDALYATMPIPK